MRLLKTQIGFTFVEVLISLFLINAILCGLMKVELFALKSSSNAYCKIIAMIQASNLSELTMLQKKTNVGISMLFAKWEQETQMILPLISSQYSCYSNQCDILIKWKPNNEYHLHFTKTA